MFLCHHKIRFAKNVIRRSLSEEGFPGPQVAHAGGVVLGLVDDGTQEAAEDVPGSRIPVVSLINVSLHFHLQDRIRPDFFLTVLKYFPLLLTDILG